MIARRVAILAAAISACQGGETTVSIAWRFGPSQLACAEAKVQTVHVFIGPLAASGSYDHEVECAIGEAGLELRGVSTGRHVLVIKGLARDHVLFSVEQDIDVDQGGDLGTIVVPAYAPP